MAQIMKPDLAQKRFNRLIRQLAASTDGPKRVELRNELARIVGILKYYSREASTKPDSVPVPKSYVQGRRQRIETSAIISGRKSITARLLQGGAPGSGKGGKRG